ncbi:hypothetical protein IB234_15980 [Pseudomonas sp. PDM16]|nr:hypothetical protein [Pseudomonas sp. PDM16]MBD9416059.1 hypothetical protein [Pseudomonas sp. PDM16]
MNKQDVGKPPARSGNANAVAECLGNRPPSPLDYIMIDRMEITKGT